MKVRFDDRVLAVSFDGDGPAVSVVRDVLSSLGRFDALSPFPLSPDSTDLSRWSSLGLSPLEDCVAAPLPFPSVGAHRSSFDLREDGDDYSGGSDAELWLLLRNQDAFSLALLFSSVSPEGRSAAALRVEGHLAGLELRCALATLRLSRCGEGGGSERCWGPSVVRVRVADWGECGADARSVRRRVFVEEQGIPEAAEVDEANDATCRHVLAHCDGQGCVGTGRLFPDGHLGRLAVLPSHRATGVGGAMARALIEDARRMGLVKLALSAQVTAEAFWTRLGFQRVGRVYAHPQAKLDHVDMEMKL